MPSSPVRSVHRRPVAVLWTWRSSSALRVVRGSVTAPSECRKPALTSTVGETIAERKPRRARVDRGRECGDQREGFAREITIAPYFSDKVWLALTGCRNNRSQANAHPRHPLRHEHFDRGGLRRDGPQPHPTPHGSGWPAFERRPDVRWDRAGVHWAIRRQLIVKSARVSGRKRHTCREPAAGSSSYSP